MPGAGLAATSAASFREPAHGFRRCRVVAPAVCLDRPLSLPVRAADARLGLHAGDHGERLCDDQPADLADHHALLGDPVRHQLRARRRHRPDHGVRVRHQLVLLLALCRRRLRRAAGHRGPDGLLPRSHLRRRHVLRLGKVVQAHAPAHHRHGGAGLQPVGPVDPDRQRLDAESGGVGLQPPDHAHGSGRLRRGAAQSGGPGQVRAHGQRRLCHRLGLRVWRFGAHVAARQVAGSGQTLDDGGGRLRPGLVAVGRRTGRCLRLRLDRQSEDEAGRARGHVEHRARAGRPDRLRLSRHEDPHHTRGDQNPLCAGPDRHPQPGPPGRRHTAAGRQRGGARRVRGPGL